MTSSHTSRIAIIGGGPAGLMAAERLLQLGHQVDLYDAMPSVGRKFLLAGVGGMNITHSEPAEAFLGRYREAAPLLAPALQDFGADALRAWVHGLGIETFIGSSGKVFPREMKAAPLLRAWLGRLREQGLRIHVRHRWQGWNEDGSLRISHPDGELAIQPDAVILALGGGSWRKLGSDGSWVPLLTTRGAKVSPLKPANCGFACNWSDFLASRFAGTPLKNIAIQWQDSQGQTQQRRGECVITAHGLEGNLVYACGADWRDRILQQGHADILLDLLPDLTLGQIEQKLLQGKGAASLANHLRKQLKLDGARSALLHECLPKTVMQDMRQLAAAIKQLPLRLHGMRPIDEAISTAGGVAIGSTANTSLHSLPGVFCAGEMLDWEAPTGGYLLTACFATGRLAAEQCHDWLNQR